MVYAMMVGRLRWRAEKVGSCILTGTRVRTPVRSRKNWGMLNNNSDQWGVSIWSRDLLSTNHRRGVLSYYNSVIWWAAVGLSATLHLHHATYGITGIHSYFKNYRPCPWVRPSLGAPPTPIDDCPVLRQIVEFRFLEIWTLGLELDF